MLRLLFMIVAIYVLGGPAFDGWRPATLDLAMKNAHAGVNRELGIGVASVVPTVQTRGVFSAQVRPRLMEDVLGGR